MGSVDRQRADRVPLIRREACAVPDVVPVLVALAILASATLAGLVALVVMCAD